MGKTLIITLAALTALSLTAHARADDSESASDDSDAIFATSTLPVDMMGASAGDGVDRKPAITGPATDRPTGENADLYTNENSDIAADPLVMDETPANSGI